MLFKNTVDYFWTNDVNIFTIYTLYYILIDLGLFLFIYTNVLMISDLPTTSIPYFFIES